MPDQKAASSGQVIYQQPAQGQMVPAGAPIQPAGVPEQHPVGSPPQG